MSETTSTKRNRNSLRFKVLWVVYLVVLVEAFSYVGLFVLSRMNTKYQPYPAAIVDNLPKDMIHQVLEGPKKYIDLDGELGWVPRTNYQSKVVTTNDAGMRSLKNTAKLKPKEKTRVATFGDSFTFGSETNDKGTWQDQLESQNTKLEVLNFGVPAYGLDQAYMRYLRERNTWQVDIVVLGFFLQMSNRLLTTFSPFGWPQSRYALGKPRFTLGADGNLVLRPNPLPTRDSYKPLLANPVALLPQIGRYDENYQSHYDSGPLDALAVVRFGKICWSDITRKPRTYKANGQLNEASEAFRITTVIAESFQNDVFNQGKEPIILLFPSREDIGHYKKGNADQVSYFPLRKYLTEHGIRFLDVGEKIQAHIPENRMKTFFAREGHYSSRGNALVAEAIANYLAPKL